MSSPVAEPPAAPPPASPGATTGVLFATAPGGPDGLPAAAWPWEAEAPAGGEPGGRDRTLLERLAAQLASLGVRDLHVVIRPGHEPATAGLALSGAHVQVSADAAADLRFVAALASAGDGSLVLAGAEIVTQREALAGLLADPRVATGILATSGRIARPYGYRTKTRRGRLVSAASPFHTTAEPNQTFLGVLKVAPADRARLALVAEQLAALRASPPEDWRRELEFCKAGTWKLAAERIRRAAVESEAQLTEADEEEERGDDPEAEGDPEASDEAPGDIERQNPEGVELSAADAAELERRMAAAAEEVPALLLVGLVRDGAQIGNSFLRSLFWARPLTEDAVRAARAQIAAHDEEAELLRSAVKASDGFFTTFFVSPLSKYVARWCAGRFTPNQVTTFSLVVGILAAAAFATGEREGLIAGSALAYLAFFLDCVDGQLARYSRTFSKLGAWLDSIFDRTKEYVLFAGLAIGASQMGEPAWVLACAALALQTTRHAIDFSYPTTQHQVIAVLPHAPLERPGDGFGLNTPLWLRPPPVPKDQRPSPPVSLPVRAFRRWRRVGRGRRATWIRKAITFPIGERFAVIALVTAIFSPRTTFIVLLAWGGFAAAYIVAGRLLRALRSPTAVAPPGSVRGRLESYRDDGPLARALRVPLPLWPVALITVALLPLVVAVVLERDAASDGLAIAVVAWLVLVAGLSANLAHRDRLRWLVPPGLRVAEFAGVIWLAALDGPAAVPAAFGFLSAVCFREYDLVYRLRHRGTEADPWVTNLGLGWEGRLLLVLVLLVSGLLPTGLWVAGALLMALFVADAVRAWTSFGRAPKAPVYADEEEENE